MTLTYNGGGGGGGGGGGVVIKDTLARVYPYHTGPCPCITRAIWRGWRPISQYQVQLS